MPFFCSFTHLCPASGDCVKEFPTMDGRCHVRDYGFFCMGFSLSHRTRKGVRFPIGYAPIYAISSQQLRSVAVQLLFCAFI